MTTTEPPPVGRLLREWRERRSLSQLDLAIRADVSTRHLSFVETGRSRPTPEMILRLTEQLEVPLRERNQLLLAGGYAPAYPQHDLDGPELASVRSALRQVLRAHEPYPAVVIDRWWDLVDANAPLLGLAAGCAPHLLEPPVNVLRLSLHPDGLAARIANLGRWRAHLLGQLRHRSGRTGDERLHELDRELRRYPAPQRETPATQADVALPLRLSVDGHDLALFSIESHVASAGDVTVDELTIETFYPADDVTEKWLRQADESARETGQRTMP